MNILLKALERTCSRLDGSTDPTQRAIHSAFDTFLEELQRTQEESVQPQPLKANCAIHHTPENIKSFRTAEKGDPSKGFCIVCGGDWPMAPLAPELPVVGRIPGSTTGQEPVIFFDDFVVRVSSNGVIRYRKDCGHHYKYEVHSVRGEARWKQSSATPVPPDALIAAYADAMLPEFATQFEFGLSFKKPVEPMPWEVQ